MKSIAVRVLASASLAAIFIVTAESYNWFGAVDAYDRLRGSMFTGFFTLGGFLLSVKTFTIINIKSGVYDQDAYKRLHVQKAPAEEPLHQRLRQLSSLLHYAILSSLVTSFAQLTIGMIKSIWAVAVCFATAAATASLLLTCLSHLRTNLDSWFNNLDEDWKEKRPNVVAEIERRKQASRETIATKSESGRGDRA